MRKKRYDMGRPMVAGMFEFLLFFFLLLLLWKEEKRNRRTEYALQAAQINPHFIYKTLNTVIFLSKKGNQQEIIQAVRSLEIILKDKLRIDRIQIYDTLDQELDVIEQYLTIQRIYYQLRITLLQRIPAELRQENIPKNILLPIVENALYHGILQKEDAEGRCPGGTIVIEAEKTENGLTIRIRDDGCGMTGEQIETWFNSPLWGIAKERGKHIGIINIRRRLHQLSDRAYTLEAKSRVGKGTEVVINMNGRRRPGDKQNGCFVKMHNEKKKII